MSVDRDSIEELLASLSRREKAGEGETEELPAENAGE
jgi:hypothetical protein